MHYFPIDRILSVEARRATAIKNVTFTEDYLATHFPMFPVVPGAMMVDSLLELAGALLEAEVGVGVGVGVGAGVGGRGGVTLAGFRRARFKRFVRPGDQLEIIAELVELDRSTCSATLNGSFRVDGEEVTAISDMKVRWRAAAEIEAGDAGVGAGDAGVGAGDAGVGAGDARVGAGDG